MTKTEHYQLNQWDAADPVRREDFNADNAKLDAAIAAVRNETAENLQELARNVSANLGSGGQNCRIAWGSYTGDGTFGAVSPNSISVGFAPVMLFLVDLENAGGGSLTFWRGCGSYQPFMSSTSTITWSNTGVTWYNNQYATYQYNESGHTYLYCVLGYSSD